ncbi:hypothetical protein QR680_015096 [Steinernema hermaphroditum]|uniref:7TM GPCR serpentine receptor class x (Srx) domain-containing protein n=1 Tax=Steinernema hermaphroditum TaxID=289476 RepID=A0AA39IDS9_9BILA|nr:hypothetical protein QR680_015096 [Steinernema hermaphroditum]
MGVFTLSTVLALSVWILIVLVVLFVILNFYLVRRMAKSQTAFRPLPMTTKIGVEPNGNYIHRIQTMPQEGNPTEEFVYGSELQGHGHMSRLDTLVGLSIWMLASAAVMVGFLNLYLIKKLSIFHNSFGVLWVSRTIGEIGANLPNIFYAGPVTVFQPRDIDPITGIVAWTVAFFFSFESCIMVQSVSANRMIAVCSPLNYDYIFTKRLTATLITVTWFAAALIISMYYIVPCSLLVRNKAAARESTFKRNVRFFAQTAFQNITMMGTLVFQVLANNSKESGRHEYFVLAYDTLILTQLNNGLALILFNPEVHEFLGINFWCLKKRKPAVLPCSTTALSSTLTIAARIDD